MKYRLPTLRAEQCLKDAEANRAQYASRFARELRTQGDVSCVKGCHHCCYNPLLTSVLEGISVYRWLAEHRKWTTALKERFLAARDQTVGLSIPVWLLSQIPCPLLDEGKGLCGAYEGRPFTCRVTFSTGDPYYCHPHRVGEAAGIAPRREALDQVAFHERTLLRRMRVPYFRMPFASAVLLGEKISKGDISIEDYPKEEAVFQLEKG